MDWRSVIDPASMMDTGFFAGRNFSPLSPIGANFSPIWGNFSPIGATASVYELDFQKLVDIVMPELEHMANNAELLERVRERRFNRDEPPPCRSPSPDDDDHVNNDYRPVLWPTSARDNIIAEIKDLLDQPLSEEEIREAQRDFEAWHTAYHPGRRYEVEATLALHDMMHDPGFHVRAWRQRQMVFVRHGIKKRWERLGVWNPEWGIPGRVNEEPRDKTSSWKWRWQGDTPYDGTGRGANGTSYSPQHINSRAIHLLREGLRRGEWGPLPPRHCLAADASQSIAESFITSRPWYIYALDEEEERVRLHRVPWNKKMFYNMNHQTHVRARWKERSALYPGVCWLGGKWKWPHESPSPEPEALSSMDLTPSEIDALEAIPPPTPPPPRPPRPPSRSLGPVILFGKGPASFPKVSESTFVPSPRAAGAETEAVEAREEIHEDGEEEVHENAAAAAPSTPQQDPKCGRPRGRPRGQRARRTPGNAPEPWADGPRRSARIAERARRLEIAAAQTDPAKTTRLQRGVPHQTKRSRGTSTEGAGSASPKGRGRPPGAVPSKASKPQGIAKKRRRWRKM